MIYFDHAASTRPFDEALSAFCEASSLTYANPASAHAYGRQAARKLEEARRRILKAFSLSEKTHGLIFLSGASEANNLALKGIASHYGRRDKRILVSNVEHPSVIEPAKQLLAAGYDVSFLPVNRDGCLDPQTVAAALDERTILVSAMAVNNETGAINPIGEIAEVVHRFPRCFFHVDATQAIGKEPLPYDKIDLFSFSAHKFGGIKGSGGLVYRRQIAFDPLVSGGGQENGFRSGTSALPLDVALGVALEKAINEAPKARQKAREINAYLRQALLETGEVAFNSSPANSPFILNFSLLRKKASVTVEALSREGIYVSSVSACSSKGEPVSEVLRAMGKSEAEAANSIRLSFGNENTLEEAMTFMRVFNRLMKELIDR